jgi:hypothetical protein
LTCDGPSGTAIPNRLAKDALLLLEDGSESGDSTLRPEVRGDRGRLRSVPESDPAIEILPRRLGLDDGPDSCDVEDADRIENCFSFCCIFGR